MRGSAGGISSDLDEIRHRVRGEAWSSAWIQCLTQSDRNSSRPVSWTRRLILSASAGHIGRDQPPEATRRHSARERWAHRARSTTRGVPASFCAQALEGQAPACPRCAAINPRRACGCLPLQLQMEADAKNEAAYQGSGLNRTHSFHSFHSWFPIPSTRMGANKPRIPDPPRTLPPPGTSGGTPLLLYAVA